MHNRVWLALTLPVAAAIGWQAAAQSSSPANDAPARQAMSRAIHRLGSGYFEVGPLPGSLGWSPPPPAPGSPAEARDIQAAASARLFYGGPRWALAIRDAELGSGASDSFSCAAGVDIGPDTTPKVERLLRKSMANLALSTSAIKEHYRRPRPFMVNGLPTCTPDVVAILRSDGSYPSGHSAIGFGWGLILAELLPDRTAQLVARGRAFGDSRRICNVHWLSDTEEGRIAASATVARLHAEARFRADLEAARKELRRKRAPARECATEEAALALG